MTEGTLFSIDFSIFITLLPYEEEGENESLAGRMVGLEDSRTQRIHARDGFTHATDSRTRLGQGAFQKWKDAFDPLSS